MTRTDLLRRNLAYHWRANLAIFLGVAVGTAVLTGALLVGDSLRGSLRDVTLRQLGWVNQVLVGPRFFREGLARDLGADRACAALLLRGSASLAATAGPPDGERRIGQVAVLGVDEHFWPPDQAPVNRALWQSSAPEVLLNQALADELGAAPGDTITLSLQKASAIPRETLLGRRDVGAVVGTVRLTVRALLPAAQPGANFSLNPSPAPPRNAFVPLHALQAALHEEGRVNALLVGGTTSTADLQARLGKLLTLDDWGLVLHAPESRTQALFAKVDRNDDNRLAPTEWRRRVATTFAQAADRDGDQALTRAEVLGYYREQRPYLSLESRQMLLEPAAADAALAAAKELGLRAAPTLVYLANRIADGPREIPYSVVAALDPTQAPPLGPFLPPGVERLADDEIVLVDWKDSPLQAQPGDQIALTYFLPEEQGRLREATATFRLRGLIPLQGAAADPDVTPEFPGITDKLDIREWDPPFPYDNKRVQKRDEQFWEQYRTTPKAYLNLAAGQRLWGSRYGQLTSIRLAPAPAGPGLAPADLALTAEEFRARLLRHLQPEQGGFVFDPVRERVLEASAGGTDFGGLFLGFSFFLIAAALVLVGLLFRLNLDRRGAEMGVLLAAGWRRGAVRRLLLGEGAVLAALGAAVGLGGAVLYAWLLLGLLRAWWPGRLDRSFLTLHVTAQSLLIGYAASLLVSVLTILWAVRVLGRVAPRALLAGETTAAPEASASRPARWSPWVAGLAAVGAVALALLGRGARDHEMQAGSFFGSGALLLIGALALVWTWMRSSRQGRVRGQGAWALARLGTRNAARHPVRSLLTAGLLASAAFLVVAVESFHRDPGADFLDRHSGSGGFALLAESDVPVFQDLNSRRGREELNIPDRAQPLLDAVTFVPFRLRAGDDASCLNLYQPRRPRLLGVPQSLVERDGFHFKATEADTPEERANPWLLLDRPLADGAIPVFGEANTVIWMLKSGLGQALEVPDERGEPRRLRIVGLLQDSVFQSELLLSEANFLRLYPHQEGYQFFLLDTPRDTTASVQSVLETALADHGFAVTPSARRLEAYLAVENTYLATFQALGGLGLLLGALGLAVVLMRSAWERRGELALLRALGFRRGALGWLVLAESAFLLLLGLAAGVGAALAAVAPHVLTQAGTVPWTRLVGLLALVLVVGLAAGAAATAATLRAPLLPALRRE